MDKPGDRRSDDRTPSLEELLDQADWELLSVTRRLFVVEAIAHELTTASRGKPFRIWHDTMWMMALDVRDMHVLCLASWLKAMFARGGFFGQLGAHYLKRLAIKKPSGTSGGIAAIVAKNQAVAFQRLFPDCAVTCPMGADLNALKQRFIERVRPVITERDTRRAHPFERVSESIASAGSLQLEHLRDTTRFAESLLKDLRLVATGIGMEFSEINAVPAAGVAKEIVDAILVGESNLARVRMGDTGRMEFYARLHRWHDELRTADTTHFNDFARYYSDQP
jgi:hypothetical protein